MTAIGTVAAEQGLRLDEGRRRATRLRAIRSRVEPDGVLVANRALA